MNLHEIRMAGIRAAEDAVVRDLEKSGLAALTGAQPAPAAPSGYLHEADETAHGRGHLRMYSSTAESPWAHWRDAYKVKCVFKTTPLYAAPAAQPADSAMEVLRDARLYLENCTEHRIGIPAYEMMAARIYRFIEASDRARTLSAASNKDR